MKVQQLFEAAEKTEQIIWDLSELEGKKMNREKAINFVAKLPYVTRNSPKGSIFEVKKNVKFNMAKLIKLLNAMDPSISAHKWSGSTRKFDIDFNFEHPVAGKILYVPPTIEDYKKMSKEERAVAEKKFGEMIVDLKNKEREKRGGKGPVGWFLSRTATDWFGDILGEFLEGPSKGDYFKVTSRAKDLNVGDIIEVIHEPTYGRVEVKK